MGLALILIASIAAVAGTDDAKKDLDKMQGTWTVTAAERDGPKVPEKELQAMQVVIKDVVIDIIHDRNDKHSIHEKSCLTLTPTTKPRSFDLALTKGAKSKLAVGIYELTDNTLKLCWRRAGGERPSEFAVKPKSDSGLFVFRRDKKE